MKRERNYLIVFILAVCIVLSNVGKTYAASGTCEIYYFTYEGAVGEGGSASIQSYLGNVGYTVNRYADVHAYYVRRTMNSDKVFVIVAHGVPGRILCKDGITTLSASQVPTDDNNYSLEAWFSANDLNGMLFAYYGACYSATTDSTYGNLLTYTTGTLGANCALGFSTSVSDTHATYYETCLFEALGNGDTVLVANNVAMTLTYFKYNSYGNINSAVISGNANISID